MEQATEMSDCVSAFPPHQLCWLVLNCPELNNFPNWSPAAILLAELLKRDWPSSEGWMLTRTGWITDEGIILDYDDRD